MASPHARTHLPGTTAKPPDSPPEAVSAQVNTRTVPLSRTSQCSLTVQFAQGGGSSRMR
jgi:hypothetical protein